MGVLKYKEKYYAFSSRSAAYEFVSKADEFISAAVETAKRQPELIQLLQLHQEFASVTPYSEVASAVWHALCSPTMKRSQDRNYFSKENDSHVWL